MREAQAIGCSSPDGNTCEITAPMPCREASVSSFNGNVLLTCVKLARLTVCLLIVETTFADFRTISIRPRPLVIRLVDG